MKYPPSKAAQLANQICNLATTRRRSRWWEVIASQICHRSLPSEVRSRAAPVRVCRPDLQLDGIWEEIVTVGGDRIVDLNRNQSPPSEVWSRVRRCEFLVSAGVRRPNGHEEGGREGGACRGCHS
ncbi:hypothetical protein TIFTF001_014353 [Ficus carica]|uniref:Uncharacterized protein n=1 Tax=Ficus carica TaxID=3494 RepID=A0AA88AFW2_FICCA|nr:hypothetical protein TIFTF001_014353 [Ficus carica]